MTEITGHKIQEADRAGHVASLFGPRYLQLESFVFDVAASLSPAYHGGRWTFFSLSNGGFFMAPAGERLQYRVECDNGYEGSMSASAFGVTVCLYAYSLLSFSANNSFAGICAEHYHRLRAFALLHDEATAILAATD